MVRTHASSPRLLPVQRLALLVIGLAQFNVAMDFSTVYVAMPSMGADLSMSESRLQWIVTAYSLPFAGFLLLGGKLVDRIGATRVFLLGSAVFGLASLVAGLAWHEWALIGGRGLQGLAGAFMSPAILTLLSANFPTGEVRSRAYAIWGAIGASGLAAGVIIGGVFTEATWRLIFLSTIPVIIFCLWGAKRIKDTAREAGETSHIPALSSTLGTVAVLLLVLALTNLADSAGSDTLVLVSSAAAAVALVAFVLNERRSAAPLIHRRLRGIPSLRYGSLAAALYMSSVGTEFFIVTLFLQDQRDYAPLAAGIAFLPLAGLITVGNIVAGRLLRTWSPAQVLGLGFTISAAGLGMLAVMLPIESYWAGLLPGFLVSGFGHGMVYTSVFVLGTSQVPQQLNGAAGALITSSQFVSNAIGIAALTLIVTHIAEQFGFVLAFSFNTIVAVGGITLAIGIHLGARRTLPAKVSTQPCET